MKNILMAVLIAFALSVFVVFWDSPPEVFLNKNKTPETSISRANSYMINSQTRKFNDQGLQAFSLTTIRGQFFKHQDKFVMDKPKIKANSGNPGKAPWHLTANTGTVFERGKRIVMQGDVNAWQPAPDGNTQIKTTQLTFYPDRDVAETDRKVYLSSPGTRINGVGMKANLDQQTFKLLSKVKSQHHASH